MSSKDPMFSSMSVSFLFAETLPTGIFFVNISAAWHQASF
nr:unnamed protein product [Moritella viscosa]